MNFVLVENRDRISCFQSCVKMVLEASLGRNFSWDKVDEIVGTSDCPDAIVFYTLQNLSTMGFEVEYVDHYDPEEFQKNPEDYINSYFGSVMAQRVHLDNETVRRAHAVFLSNTNIIKRFDEPTIECLVSALKSGWLAIVQLDYSRLHGQEHDFSYHAVVVTGSSANSLVVQDPGPPGRENLEVERGTFENAWHFPSKQASNLILLRWTS